jgi:hypothetical protein
MAISTGKHKSKYPEYYLEIYPEYYLGLPNGYNFYTYFSQSLDNSGGTDKKTVLSYQTI